MEAVSGVPSPVLAVQMISRSWRLSSYHPAWFGVMGNTSNRDSLNATPT